MKNNTKMLLTLACASAIVLTGCDKSNKQTVKEKKSHKQVSKNTSSTKQTEDGEHNNKPTDIVLHINQQDDNNTKNVV